MKKLFTLFAFLACFLGANAVTIVDAEVDFSKYKDISEWGFPYGWGGSGSAKERLSIQDGCLHFESAEATDPTWDCQFFPIGCNAEDGVTYTVHFKIKGDHAENISLLGFGQTPYGQFPITTDWVEGTVTYESKGTDGNLLMQCGGYVGSFDIAYLKITHEGRDEKPVEWKNILTNGDAEGEFGEVPCAQRKEFGIHSEAEPDKEWIREAEIIDDPDATSGQGKVFHTQSQIVNPVIMNSEGTSPDASNTWQNQFWIVFPRPMLAGEGYKVSFKYKASEAIRVSTQTHKTPGNYLGGGFGDVNFTTQWQTFESKELTAANSGDLQSIAFQFGEDQAYLKSIDFYFDDIQVMTMDLKDGFFVAGLDANAPDANWNTFNFDTAVELEWDDELEAYTAVVGTPGDQDSWVNQVMVSTKYGNDKGFKANTIKVTGRVKNDPEQWLPYSAAAKTPINLPAHGVWQVALDPDDGSMNFTKIEGEADAVPVDIVVNTNVLVVDALERDFKPADNDGNPVEAEIGTGQPWDSQFWIVANRTLKAGEETYIEFDYVASLDEANVGTQTQKPGFQYLGNDALGTIKFTNEEQHFTLDYTIKNDGMQSIAFNMAEIKAACNYTIKNVKWYLKDADLEPDGQTMENLIKGEGTDNFFLKEGAGYAIHQIGTDPVPPTGIQNVTAKSAKTSTAIYNLAGQRVANDYKGIVVKDGKKFVK